VIGTPTGIVHVLAIDRRVGGDDESDFVEIGVVRTSDRLVTEVTLAPGGGCDFRIVARVY
jgi:hypothetical protein